MRCCVCGVKKRLREFSVPNDSVGVDLFCKVCKRCRLKRVHEEEWKSEYGVLKDSEAYKFVTKTDDVNEQITRAAFLLGINNIRIKEAKIKKECEK